MATKPELEFFYDCSSPWTYFAFARLVPLAEELGQTIQWRPILVGGVFNSINPQLYAARESMFANERRVKHYFKDMQDWSEYVGITVQQPDVFPVNRPSWAFSVWASFSNSSITPSRTRPSAGFDSRLASRWRWYASKNLWVCSSVASILKWT